MQAVNSVHQSGPGRGLLKALREPFLGLIGGTFPINHRHYDRGPYIIPEAPPESE